MNNLYLPNQLYSRPTREEQVVNEKLLGECGHHRQEVGRNRFGEWEAHCLDCHERCSFRGADRPRPTRDDARNLLLSFQLRPARCKLNAYPVQYRLQEHGWAISFMTVNGLTRCTLEKTGRVIRSDPQPDEPKALVQAAARMCLTTEFNIVLEYANA